MDELKELLSELAETEPLPAGQKPKSKKKADAVVDAPPIARRPKPEPTMMLVQAEETKKEEEALPDIFNKQFTKVFKRYNTIFDDIIQNYQHDRVQAQEVIDAFMAVIATGGKVPRIYLEKVADAVRAKNEIAQTALRALESIPKLMAASKGNEVFNQVNMSFDASQLAELLKTDKYEDESNYCSNY
jgi:hypothetical protein